MVLHRINEGRGSANTVQVVAAGSDTFGLADSSSVVLTASKGADVNLASPTGKGTPLKNAERNGEDEIAAYLRSKGAVSASK